VTSGSRPGAATNDQACAYDAMISRSGPVLSPNDSAATPEPLRSVSQALLEVGGAVGIRMLNHVWRLCEGDIVENTRRLKRGGFKQNFAAALQSMKGVAARAAGRTRCKSV